MSFAHSRVEVSDILHNSAGVLGITSKPTESSLTARCECSRVEIGEHGPVPGPDQICRYRGKDTLTLTLA